MLRRDTERDREEAQKEAADVPTRRMKERKRHQTDFIYIREKEKKKEERKQTQRREVNAISLFSLHATCVCFPCMRMQREM